MQPKRLLQATGLLLLSAAVFAQVESMAAMPSMAALPAEVQPAATNCFKEFGTDCRWGESCSAQVTDCQLCEEETCAYCKAGYFLDTDANTCTRCPQGGFCGGKSTDPTEPGSKWACPFPTFTDEGGRWSPTQCTSCFVGYGTSSCAPCGPGTAKNLVGSKECDYCLDGFVANSNLGATDCLDVGAGRRKLLQAADPRAADEACEEALETDVDEPAVYIADENSCGCPAWSVLKLPEVVYDEDLDWEVVPARCVDECPNPGEVFSIDGEPEVGLTKCFTCPANTENVGNTRCRCKDGFIPRANFKADGCRADPAATAPDAGGNGGGDDDEEDEWGHWSHKKDKKHGKHGKYGKYDKYSGKYDKYEKYDKYSGKYDKESGYSGEEKEYDDRK